VQRLPNGKYEIVVDADVPIADGLPVLAAALNA